MTAQRKQRQAKPDPKMGTIEQDEDYVQFLEQVLLLLLLLLLLSSFDLLAVEASAQDAAIC
jgi:hypothetical protein